MNLVAALRFVAYGQGSVSIKRQILGFKDLTRSDLRVVSTDLLSASVQGRTNRNTKGAQSDIAISRREGAGDTVLLKGGLDGRPRALWHMDDNHHSDSFHIRLISVQIYEECIQNMLQYMSMFLCLVSGSAQMLERININNDMANDFTTFHNDSFEWSSPHRKAKALMQIIR